MKGEKKMRTYCARVALVALAIAAWSSCAPERELRSDLEREEDSVIGLGVVSAEDSRAERLDTVEGVAGAVVRISSAAYAPDFCTGTLIARDRVITNADCAYQGSLPLNDLSVGLAQDESTAFDVKISVKIGSLLVAILVLNEQVPTSLVENIPSLFAGPMEESLDADYLLPESGVIIGHGSHMKRRLGGRIRTEVTLCDSCPFVGQENILTAELDPTQGAAIGGIGDAGSPLFLWDRARYAYSLVGVMRSGSGLNGAPIVWDGIGKASEADTGIDLFSFLQGFWINGDALEVAGEGYEPPVGAEPLLGWDLDGDRVLDAGDNCPPSKCIGESRPVADCANPKQSDANMDGIGDDCSRPFSCEVPEPPSENYLFDPYADPFAADEWRLYLLRLWAYGQLQNSNLQIEEARVAEKLPDRCDPLPVLRISTTWDRFPLLEPLTLETGTFRFKGDPWMGEGTNDPYIDAEVDFRFCDCRWPHGIKHPLGDCHQIFRPCHAAQVHTETILWRQNLSVDGPPVLEFRRGGEMKRENYEWSWLSDAYNHVIGSTQGLSTHVYGLFASIVERDRFQSTRDGNHGGYLRASIRGFSRESLPVGFEIPDPLKRFPPDVILGSLSPGLWEDLRFPERSKLPFALPILGANEDLLLAIGGNLVTEVASAMSEDLKADLLGGKQTLILAPVESGRLLEFLGLPITSLAIERSGDHAGRARVVGSSHGSRQLSYRQEFPPMATDFDPGASYVYSAFERALYVVGGDSAPSTIRRYDFLNGNVHHLSPLTYSIGAEILAATHNPVSGRTVVLERVVEAGVGYARLVSYDLLTDAEELLWMVESTNEPSFVGLHVSEDANLLLSLGDDQGYSVCLLDAASGDQIGAIEGEGRIFAHPTMGHEHLWVPVVTDDGLDHRSLEVREFQEGGESECKYQL